MAPVLVKPEPRPDVDRLALEGSGRERARRREGGTGAMVIFWIFCSVEKR